MVIGYHTISKSLYRISLTVHPGPVGAVSNRTGHNQKR